MARGARAKLTVRDIDRGFLNLRRVMRTIQASASYAMAGVSEARNNRSGEDITNAELAVIHEFGAPAAGIPERPFMRPAFDANRVKYELQILRGVKRIYDGKTDPMKLLALLGQTMAADMKARILQGPPIPPPNTPRVRARKEALRRKGSKGEVRTLVDTGRMVQSIGHAVVFAGQTVGVRLGGSAAGDFRIPNPNPKKRRGRKKARRRGGKRRG